MWVSETISKVNTTAQSPLYVGARSCRSSDSTRDDIVVVADAVHGIVIAVGEIGEECIVAVVAVGVVDQHILSWG